MNPNSTHQLWFKWTIVVSRPTISAHAQPHHRALVTTAWATFAATEFGRAGAARMTQRLVSESTTGQGKPAKIRSEWTLELLTEGTPLHDPGKEAEKRKAIETWVTKNFGASAERRIECDLRAGDLQDGKPPEQMLIVPRIESTVLVNGPGS